MSFGAHKLVHSEPFLDCRYEIWLLQSALCSDVRKKKLEPRFLVNFVPVWEWIASPIMHRFQRCFRHLLPDQMFFVTH